MIPKFEIAIKMSDLELQNYIFKYREGNIVLDKINAMYAPANYFKTIVTISDHSHIKFRTKF